MIGQTISHYRITEKLGEGGMGVVYKAEDTKLERPVALKFLAPHLLRDEEGRKRFEREAKAAAKLDHPNICMVFEIDEVDARTFIVMAFLEGRTLSKKIADGPLKLPEALSIAIQMADGLEAAHEKGIVHRDIKPDNVMLMKGSRGLVKLMDFGLAQLAESSKLTRDGTTLGTPIYMSPEQALGESTDKRADVWAIGVVLYEMVAGQPPFRGERDQAVIYAIANEPHEPLTAVRTGVPKELERIVDKCLAKSTDERYQHVSDLLVDLQHLRKEIGAETPDRSKPVPPSRSSRPVAVAGLALVVVVGLVWWLMRPRSSTLKPPEYKLTQLTRDPGLTFQPALSPDGKMVTYASDRAGQNNLDIYVQQVSGGEPLPLATHEADDYHPSFSPNGSQIVFRSDREGGGIFIVSALGGRERLLASGAAASSPSFSPDGTTVAYSVGGMLRESKVYLVPVAGGPSQPLEFDIPWASWPVWSPDGSQMLFVGSQKERVYADEDTDWYVAPVDGGKASKVGAPDELLAAGTRMGFFGARVRPVAWLDNPQRVIFAARSGDIMNVYQVPMSSDPWRLSGPPQQLTRGTRELEPSVALNGLLAFSDHHEKSDIWFLPMNPNTGSELGDLQRVVASGAEDHFPTISDDGTTLVFTSKRRGNSDVWVKDLRKNQETQLTSSPENELRALISPDGTRVAFTRGSYGGDSSLYVSPINGVEEKVTDNVVTIICWSSDSRRILYARAEDGQEWPVWSAIDVDTGDCQDVIRSSKRPVHSVKYSPDNHWISFTRLPEVGIRETWVAPLHDGVAGDESEWIQITARQADAGNWWSPDGNLLYYVSARDGFSCIWARPLDPSTKHPLGEQFAVKHFHGTTSRLRSGYGLAPNGFYFGLSQAAGNIWLAEPQSAE